MAHHLFIVNSFPSQFDGEEQRKIDVDISLFGE